MMFKQHVHEVITFFFFFFSFFFFLSFSSTPSPSSSLRWPSSIPSGNACAPPAGQEISLQPKQQHFPSFQPKLDMLKSQSSTHTSQFRGQFFCCFKLFLGLSRQKKAMIICVFVHIYIWYAYSKRQYFTLSASSSFFLSPSALGPAISPPAENEKVQQYCINVMNRFDCDNDCCCGFHWLLCFFQSLRSGKYSPAAERAVALLSSFCSSSCEKANAFKLRLTVLYILYFDFPLQIYILYAEMCKVHEHT